MPLSEHEQKLLEQIEQALYAEDPKFAHSWRAKANVRGVRRARVVRGIVAVVLGLGLLVAGVIGFLLMLGGAWLALSTRQRPALRAAVAAPASAPVRRERRSLLARLEERWQRRQERGGGF